MGGSGKTAIAMGYTIELYLAVLKYISMRKSSKNFEPAESEKTLAKFYNRKQSKNK